MIGTYLRGRQEQTEKTKNRSAGFRTGMNEIMEKVRRHSPKGVANPVVKEMFNFLSGLLNSAGEVNTTVYKDGQDAEVLANSAKRQVDLVRNMFDKQVLDLYRRLDHKHKYPNQQAFEKELSESFWRGLLLFLKVEYNTEIEDVERPAATISRLGAGRTLRIPAPKLEALQRGVVNLSYQPKVGQDESEISPNLGIHNFAVICLKWYATFYFKTFKVCLEKKLSLKQVFTLSERVYGYESLIFDEIEKEPFGLDQATIAHMLLSYPLRARESFNKWAELKNKKEGEEQSFVEKFSQKDWAISPIFVRNLILRYPLTVELGMELVDERIDQLSKGEFKLIPKAIIIETIVKNPKESDGADKDGYYEDLNNIKMKAEFLLSRFKNGPIFATPPKIKEDGDLLRDFGLTNFIYSNVAIRGSIFDENYIGSIIQHVEEMLKNEKNIASFSAKRRILSKMLRFNYEGMSQTERDSKLNVFLGRVIQSERRRISAQNKMLKNLFQYAEEINPVWGSYYVLFGYSDIPKNDSGYSEDYIANGQLVVDLIVEEMKSNYGEDGDEKVEDYFETMFDVLSKYLSDQRFTDSEMFKNQASFGEFKMALLLQPRDPKSYYEKIKHAKEGQMRELGDSSFKMAEWDDSIKNITIETDIYTDA